MPILEHRGQCAASWIYVPGEGVIICCGCGQRYESAPERRFVAAPEQVLGQHMQRLADPGAAILQPERDRSPHRSRGAIGRIPWKRQPRYWMGGYGLQEHASPNCEFLSREFAGITATREARRRRPAPGGCPSTAESAAVSTGVSRSGLPR